ncbi:YbaB/EbfC DNA-binding family protein [Lentzea albidocapillata subsp. violacea]|uniref:YbaB/EbfC DNA-binding family protein n=1 Tax=Lentzea albidocapillata subsp. violacea TaxID=128104 RepID=A0A1G9HS53_9PSEU|nr:YbaB/EbfC family nucleoid-associated protein [Lentzea albidocapillata]SDL15665.1 YbaB/EbfC DNA-binding family protein [Lentzea albidocapillata subsp. violacea]
MSAEFDQLVAQFERFQSQMHRVDQQFANIDEMQQQLADMEAVATSSDRAVTVVAGPSGSIKDIRLTDQAMRRPPHALAAELMSTLQKAVAEAARRQAGIVEGALGDDMHLKDQVLETQAQLFGMSKEDLQRVTEEETAAPAPQRPPMPPPPPPAPQGGPVRQAPPPPPRRQAPESGEDFSDQNVLRGDSWQSRSPQPPPPAPPKQGGYLNLYDDEDGR